VEAPLDDRAQKRARLSRIFGSIALVIPLIALSWKWLSNGPLEPLLPGSLSRAGIALDRILATITPIVFLFWAVSGIAWWITAFVGTKNPRAFISITLSLASLLCTVPVLFLLPWFWSPATSGDHWARDRFLPLGIHILFIVMNLACVITAFYDGPRPKSWQGKTAIVLAALVAVFMLPFSIFSLYSFIQILFNKI
jgi:hypothetical protein